MSSDRARPGAKSTPNTITPTGVNLAGKWFDESGEWVVCAVWESSVIVGYKQRSGILWPILVTVNDFGPGKRFQRDRNSHD